MLTVLPGRGEGGRGRSPENAKFLLNVDTVFCCELLYLQHSWTRLYQWEQSADGQEARSESQEDISGGKSTRARETNAH